MTFATTDTIERISTRSTESIAAMEAAGTHVSVDGTNATNAR